MQKTKCPAPPISLEEVLESEDVWVMVSGRRLVQLDIGSDYEC